MALPQLPLIAILREVGPRGGLQLERPLPVGDRVRLIEALVGAGVHRVETVAFVSPAADPAMDHAAEVMAFAPRDTIVRYTALVPDLGGAESALETDVDELTVTVAVSETANGRAVGRSIDDSVAEIDSICRIAGEIPVDAVLGSAFGCPFEGDIPPRAVARLAQRLREAGCSAITCADDASMATPKRIEDVLSRTGTDVGLHLRDARGTAMVNAYAALQLGVDRFDTSIGGLGGTLATEDLVALLDDLGVRTGIDLEGLLEAAGVAAGLVDHPLPSRVSAAGPRSRPAGGA